MKGYNEKLNYVHSVWFYQISDGYILYFHMHAESGCGHQTSEMNTLVRLLLLKMNQVVSVLSLRLSNIIYLSVLFTYCASKRIFVYFIFIDKKQNFDFNFIESDPHIELIRNLKLIVVIHVKKTCQPESDIDNTNIPRISFLKQIYLCSVKRK